MLYVQPNNTGIDSVLASVQADLYAGLVQSGLWKGEINGYGRVHKNTQSDSSQIPEWYEGDKDFTPVYYNDNFAGNFFFIDEDKHSTKDEFIFCADIKVVFMLNLTDIYPNAVARQDETAHKDAVNVLRQYADSRYEVTGIEKGINKVFAGLNASQIKFLDVYPKHTFAVNLKLSYYLDEC